MHYEKFNEKTIDLINEEDNNHIWNKIEIKCPKCLITSEISNET